MSRIPQTFIDDLLNRVDIVEIVDPRVKLKRTGKNYSACCPFHDEKTPSFTVSPEKQFYYCFGCGASGTAISFLMDYDRVGFIDAVESLAKTAGVQVPNEEGPRDKTKEIHRKRCYDTLQQAASHYAEQLKSHRQRGQAVKYLQNRGLSGQIAKAYEMGYAPPGWDNLLTRLGQNEGSQKLLSDTGLTVEKTEENKRYDRFRNRIMFPIRDGRGRVIGFGGRVLGDDKPKYLNSPETDVFHKGRELYGLYEARKFGKRLDFLMVVEGYMDVIALAQYGLWNAVATLGTACSEEHLKLAFRQVNEVVFCFDGDKAGRAAAKRALLNALTSMEDGRQIRFLFLPDGQDPDSLVRQIGAERFKEQVKRALPMEEFLFDHAAEGIDLNSMDGRARFSKVAAPLIHKLPEGVFRSLMMEHLAKRTGLSLQVLSEFTEVIPVEQAPPASYHSPGATNQPPPTGDEYNSQANYDAAQEYSEYSQTHATLEYSSSPNQGRPQQFSPPSRTQISVHPARNATILLLDDPKLLQECDIELNLPESMLADPDTNNLSALLDYLRKRPEAKFNNIMGYWGGAKGIEAQQTLAKLVAKQIFGELKQIDHYNAQAELRDCLQTLTKEGKRTRQKEEIAALDAKGLDKLNSEEKQRYRELIRHH